MSADDFFAGLFGGTARVIGDYREQQAKDEDERKRYAQAAALKRLADEEWAKHFEVEQAAKGDEVKSGIEYDQNGNAFDVTRKTAWNPTTKQRETTETGRAAHVDPEAFQDGMWIDKKSGTVRIDPVAQKAIIAQKNAERAPREAPEPSYIEAEGPDGKPIYVDKRSGKPASFRPPSKAATDKPLSPTEFRLNVNDSIRDIEDPKEHAAARRQAYLDAGRDPKTGEILPPAKAKQLREPFDGASATAAKSGAGSSADNPLPVTGTEAEPPPGTWIRLPSGKIVQTR